MGQDLRKMMSVFINGVEEVRVIYGFAYHKPVDNFVPVPLMKKDEYYFISDDGFPTIVKESDLFPTEGFC